MRRFLALLTVVVVAQAAAGSELTRCNEFDDARDLAAVSRDSSYPGLWSDGAKSSPATVFHLYHREFAVGGIDLELEVA